MDDLDFPEPVTAAPEAFRPRWSGVLIPALGLAISVFFLSEERASLDYYLSSPQPVDLGAPGTYQFGAAQDGIFARIRGDLGGPPIPYRHSWQRRELVPVLDTPVLVDRARGSSPGGSAAIEGRLQREDRLPQFRKVIEIFLKRDLLAPPGGSENTNHVWVLREGSQPWRLDGDSGWCLLLLGLTGLNAWWVAQRLWWEWRSRGRVRVPASE